jgi:cytochrome c peroxidase
MSLRAPTFVACLFALFVCASGPAEQKQTVSNHSPIDLAVFAGGRYALTANHTADSVSLIDLKEGKVLAEQACGRKPCAVAVSPDGRRAAVSNLWSGTVTLLEIDKTTFTAARQVAVGPLPRGLVFSGDGENVYAAVSGADEVVKFDWQNGKVLQHWPAPREPRALALSTDGSKLAAAGTRSAQVRCWDTKEQKLLWERRIEDAFNLRGLSFTPDGEGVICAHAFRRSFPVTKQNIEEGWVIDNRLTWLAVSPDAKPAIKQIALDLRHKAVADLYGTAFDEKAGLLAITGSGTHELVLLETAHIPWTSGEPGDFLSPKLDIGEHKMRRLPLGGRPLTVAFLNDATAVVANYLSDSVQIVDVRSGKIAKEIALSAPGESTLARRGEALFYDAQRSHGQWFSCSTCHVEGHTCGLNFDTLNDDSYGNPKLTPTLRNVTKTGPWTWHGWQKDLGAGVEKSFVETMFGSRPTAEDIKAVVAFLETLDHPPNPHSKQTDAVKRGQTLFKGKARCSKCHHGDEYTSENNYDVKLEPDGSPYRLWNPPSLRGVWDRGPFLHDGRAATLQELLEKHHEPDKLGGEALTDNERRDLIAFLQSL